MADSGTVLSVVFPPPAPWLQLVPSGWRCDFETRPDVLPLLQAATGEIGASEDPLGSNDGERIRAYTGGRGGVRWCSYFATWCVRRQEPSFPSIGSAAGLLVWASRHGAILPAGDPVLPGDLWIALRHEDQDEGPHGHVAVVCAVNGDTLATVGGNEMQRVRAWWKRRGVAKAIVRPIPV